MALEIIKERIPAIGRQTKEVLEDTADMQIVQIRLGHPIRNFFLGIAIGSLATNAFFTLRDEEKRESIKNSLSQGKETVTNKWQNLWHRGEDTSNGNHEEELGREAIATP